MPALIHSVPPRSLSACLAAMAEVVWGPQAAKRPRIITQLSGPGMERFVNLLQPLPDHVGVDLGGGDLRVPQHHLDRSQIRPSLQKVCRERMPEHMRRDVFPDGSLFRVCFQDLPKLHTAERGAARGQEKYLCGVGAAAEIQIRLYSLPG